MRVSCTFAGILSVLILGTLFYKAPPVLHPDLTASVQEHEAPTVLSSPPMVFNTERFFTLSRPKKVAVSHLEEICIKEYRLGGYLESCHLVQSM